MTKVELKEGETIIDLNGFMLMDENHSDFDKSIEELNKKYYIVKAVVMLREDYVNKEYIASNLVVQMPKCLSKITDL